MKFSSESETWQCFEKKISSTQFAIMRINLTSLYIVKTGAIAEEYLEGEDPRCPSVQGCISLEGKKCLLFGARNNLSF